MQVLSPSTFKQMCTGIDTCLKWGKTCLYAFVCSQSSDFELCTVHNSTISGRFDRFDKESPLDQAFSLLEADDLAGCHMLWEV